jgi:hypothetical protein
MTSVSLEWSEILDFETHERDLPVKAEIPQCSEIRVCINVSMFCPNTMRYSIDT